MGKRFRMFMSLLVLVALMFVAACGSSESDNLPKESTDASEENNNEVSGEIVATIFGGIWHEVFTEMNAEFQKEYPDAKILLETGVSQDWLTKITAFEEGKPPINVFQGVYAAGADISSQGKTVKLSKDKIPNLEYIPDEFHSDDTVRIMFTPLTIWYNTEKVKNPPTSWEDLWKPEYRDFKLGLFNIENGVGQQFLLLTSELFGEGQHDIDVGLEKINELQPFVQSSFGQEMADLLSSGEVDIAVLDVGHGVATQKKGIPIEKVDPAEGSLVDYQVMQIIKGTENIDLAHAYINHVLSPEVQKRSMEAFGQTPANQTVDVPDNLHFSEEEIKNFKEIDQVWLNENKQEVIQKWNETILKR